MFEVYTERAKRVLAFAKYEASQMGSDTMRTEHILLGLIREAEEVILELFARWDLDPGEVRAEVEMMSTFHRRKSAPVEIAIARDAQRVLAYAVEESKKLSHKYVGTEHIFLGLLQEENGMAARILTQKGVRLAALREDVVAIHRRKAEERARIEQEGNLGEASTALSALARSLEVDPPAYLYTPAELRTIGDTFAALEAALPMRFALLAQRDGLAVCTLGDALTALESWIAAVLPFTAAPSRPHRKEAIWFEGEGQTGLLSWIGRQAFLVVVPREPVDAPSVERHAREAVAALLPIFDHVARARGPCS